MEAQLEAKNNVIESQAKAQKDAEQLARDQERRDLQLSRIRIVHDLETATHPNHKKSLEAALAHLDQKISKLT